MKEILKYLRQINNLTQEQVAEKIGISRQSYSKYEKDIVTPSISVITKLADLYKVSQEIILKNAIPTYAEEMKRQQKSFQTMNKVAEPETPVSHATEKSYDAIFDGNTIKVLSDVQFKEGQKFRLVEVEETEAERKAKAWDTINSILNSMPETNLPADYDYKEEYHKYLEAKYYEQFKHFN